MDTKFQFRYPQKNKWLLDFNFGIRKKLNGYRISNPAAIKNLPKERQFELIFVGISSILVIATGCSDTTGR